MRLCIDCKHYEPGVMYASCGRIAPTISCVDGKIVPSFCNVMRLEGQSCGPDAKLFEARAAEAA